MYLTYYYLSLVGKELLQAHSDKYSSLVKLLFAIISYLATVNRYLTIFFFFSQRIRSLERSPLDEVKKKHETIEKLEIQKMP